MSNHEATGHAIPKSTVVGSYFALLFLAAVMIGLSRLNVERLGIEWIDLHAIRTCIIMSVALVMGIIVSMFLMGLRYESKLLNLTIFLSNFVFLLIFVLFTWVDTSFRGEVDPSFNQKINFTSPVKEEAAEEHGAVGEAAHESAPAAAHEAVAAPAAAPAKEAAPAH
jgi:caa(3)-type oxidase subunit IV